MRLRAEPVGWAAATVLVLGVLVAATGVVQPQRTVAVEVVLPAVEVVVPVAQPAPEPVVTTLPASQLPVLPPPVPAGDLGPPPGPQADLAPERVAAPEDRYAVLVGVTDYRPPTTDTIGSVNDVRYVEDLLLRSGWLPGNIRVLVDEQVTGAALREAMDWLATVGQPGTFAFFHYSGHVKQLGGGTEALWPVDRDFVRDTEVTAALSRTGGFLWVDIAGCEAGSFLPGLPSERVLVSASSTATEKSYEYPDWGLSVWTGLVFGLGLSQGSADADADGRSTVGEALRYGTHYAQAITLTQEPYGRQTPQVAGSMVRGWDLSGPPA